MSAREQHAPVDGSDWRIYGSCFAVASEIVHDGVSLIGEGADLQAPASLWFSRVLRWLQRPQRAQATIDIPELRSAIGTAIGEVRKENQDRAIVARFAHPAGGRFTVFAICDGLGGMVGGSACAEIALGAFLDHLVRNETPQSQTLRHRIKGALHAANTAVFDKYRQQGGTTIALVCVTPTETVAATVGDTRLYAVLPSAAPRQISIDDTVAGEIVRLKRVDPRSLNLERFANQLAQYVGIGPEMEPRFYDVTRDDATRYVLVSDGAYRIGSPIFEQIIAHAGSPQLAVSHVLHVAQWAGGQDNASMILVAPSDSGWTEQESSTPTLELWSATSKLELVVQDTRQPAITPPGRPPPTETRSTPKSRKRKSSVRKDKKIPAQSAKQGAAKGKQPTLQIEFDDESDDDGHPKQETVHEDDPKRTAQQSANGPGDANRSDQTGKLKS